MFCRVLVCSLNDLVLFPRCALNDGSACSARALNACSIRTSEISGFSASFFSTCKVCVSVPIMGKRPKSNAAPVEAQPQAEAAALEEVLNHGAYLKANRELNTVNAKI